MSLKRAREASGLKAKDVVRVLRQKGSRIDIPLYSHCEQERVDLNARDREIVSELMDVPVEAIATAFKPIRPGNRHKRTGNPELRKRVPLERLRQIDKDIEICGYVDRSGWLDTCIHRLRVEARKVSGENRRYSI